MTDILQPKNALTVYRGTSKTFVLTVTDADGKPVNLTGARVVFTVKGRIEEQVPLLQKTSDNASQVLITGAAGGVAEIYLVPADTARMTARPYVFDVFVQLSSGKRYVVIPPSTLDLQSTVTVL